MTLKLIETLKTSIYRHTHTSNTKIPLTIFKTFNFLNYIFFEKGKDKVKNQSACYADSY